MKMIPKFTVGLERLCSSFPFLAKLCFLYYKEIVKKEIQLGEISSNERVLCIGGGSLPCTALEIAKSTGANVQVIDIDPIAVEHAKRVIRKLGMDDKIDVKLAAGQQVDISPFTVIHVALQAQPQDELLKNLWEKASEGTRILIRSPKNYLKKCYSGLSIDYCFNCRCIEQKNCTMKATYLFKKIKGELEYEEDGKAASSLTCNSVNTLVG